MDSRRIVSEVNTLIERKLERFRAPDNGISASLQQGGGGKAVINYCESLATLDLEFSGFPEG